MTTPPTPSGSSETNTAWLTPGVRGIGGASLLADIGHEIPTALLPSLLTSTLGAPASALGLIEGVSDGLAGVARLGGGALADDPSRRRTVAVGGYTTTAVLAAGTGAATAVWQVGLLRAGAWTARGLRVPARNALLADVVPPAAYGRAYGFERAMDNLGAIIGPLLALGLVATIGTRWAITVSVIPGLLAAGAIVYAIRHTTTPTKRDKTPIRLQIRPVLAVAGAAAFAIAYVGLATDTSNWIALAPWFIAAGIGIGAVETAQHAAVATAAPDHIRGSAFGLLAGVQSLGNLIASTTTGIIWTTIGPGWAFGIIGVAMIAATAVLATAQPDNCPA